MAQEVAMSVTGSSANEDPWSIVARQNLQQMLRIEAVHRILQGHMLERIHLSNNALLQFSTSFTAAMGWHQGLSSLPTTDKADSSNNTQMAKFWNIKWDH
jgi:hypothetical protein